MAMIDDLTTRVSEADAGILQQAINDAEGMILDVCNRTSIPPTMLNLQLTLAEVYVRRILAAGEDSRSEGDVSVSNSYSKEIPEDIMKRILARRKLKQAVVSHEA
ncbi:MAG: hypothetical protein PHY47_16005 [Lachnospiraceae bacterium]|nr:hypothetical protein [Lachnospiraceae bacterium]